MFCCCCWRQSVPISAYIEAVFMQSSGRPVLIVVPIESQRPSSKLCTNSYIEPAQPDGIRRLQLANYSKNCNSRGYIEFFLLERAGSRIQNHLEYMRMPDRPGSPFLSSLTPPLPPDLTLCVNNIAICIDSLVNRLRGDMHLGVMHVTTKPFFDWGVILGDNPHAATICTRQR